MFPGLGMPNLGNFTITQATAVGGTAFRALIPPNMASGPLATGVKSKGRAKVMKVCYTSGATAHKIGILRPFNYTTFAADAAAAQTSVVLASDPGLYATAFNYGAFPNGTPSVADNALAANDIVVYQNADGTYTLDIVASGTYAAVVLTNNVPTGGVKKGGLVFFYGIVTDTDPNTGLTQPQTTIAASQTRDVTWADSTVGIVSALHDGDPLVFYSPNGTNAGTMEYLTGAYGKF